MGVMRFLVPHRDRMAADAVERAYMAGLDEIPWSSRTRWTSEGLVIERAESDSGSFFIPCLVAGHGELMLSTTSLMQRDRPYHLPVELARGTLNRLRNQIAVWQSLGVSLPAAIHAPLKAAHEHLSWAATRQEDLEGAGDRAALATRASLDAIDLLSNQYVEQTLTTRHHQSGKLNTLLGVSLGSSRPNEVVARQITAACNAASVPFAWREIESREGKRDWTLADHQVEWCRSHGLKVCGGPLLEVDRWLLPDWMYLWGEDDEDSFRSCVVEHIQAVVSRYRGKVQLWQCAARLNTSNELEHTEEQRLRLAVLAIETVRRADPRAPVIISLDQPWGSFMRHEECDLSPLHFADALVRADLGVSGLGLEINVGYAPRGTEPRDLLEFGRQIDRWSSLGLPLLISLTVPSGRVKDPQARELSNPVNFSAAGDLSVGSQRAWAEKYLPVLLAKQPVQGLIWNQLLDSSPHAYAHGGLFDADDHAKPILALLQSLRRKHLN